MKHLIIALLMGFVLNVNAQMAQIGTRSSKVGLGVNYAEDYKLGGQAMVIASLEHGSKTPEFGVKMGAWVNGRHLVSLNAYMFADRMFATLQYEYRFWEGFAVGVEVGVPRSEITVSWAWDTPKRYGRGCY